MSTVMTYFWKRSKQYAYMSVFINWAAYIQFVNLHIKECHQTILFIWITSASKGAELTFPGGDNSIVVVVHTQGHFVV